MDPYAALADPVRRSLLRQLAGSPARVVDLAAAQEVSRPAVSRHLRLLGEAGLVVVEERGRERHYSLDPAGLEPVRSLLAQLTSAPLVGDQLLDRLELEVRRTVRERRTTATTTPASSTEETA